MINIDPITKERVYDLKCHCGEKGGEVRFPEHHGRASDEALEKELDEMYSHACDDHKKNG